jgi:hypothetical protein
MLRRGRNGNLRRRAEVRLEVRRMYPAESRAGVRKPATVGVLTAAKSAMRLVGEKIRALAILRRR